MVYDPSADANVLACMPHPSEFPNAFKTDTAAGTTAGLGDYVKVVNMPAMGVRLIETAADTRRPKLTADGLDFLLDTTSRGLQVLNSTVYFKGLHGGNGKLKTRFKLKEGHGSSTRPFFDNTNLSTSVVGVTAGVGALGSGLGSDCILRINNGSTSAAFIRTGIRVDDNAWHTYEAEIFPTYARVRCDKGEWVYANYSAALSTSDATINMFVGNRQSLTAEVGEMAGAWIGSGLPTAEQEAAWFTMFPQGSITGSPEVRVNDFHFNLDKNFAYNTKSLWFKDKLVYSTDGLDGPVFDDQGPDDNMDLESWRGGPHGDEVLTDAQVWVDGTPVTFADGEVYSGSTVRVQRSTTIGVSYNAVNTLTAFGNTIRENLRLTRLNDGRGINPSYLFRCSRGLSFDAVLTLDAEGNILDDFSASLTDGTFYELSDNGDATRAVAQFSSTLGIMCLFVLTQGYGSDEQFLIIGSNTNKRLYMRVATTRRSPAAGTVIELSQDTKWYETDSGSWKSLAQSELVKLLNPSSSGDRSGIGAGRLGMGL